MGQERNFEAVIISSRRRIGDRRYREEDIEKFLHEVKEVIKDKKIEENKIDWP